jgi:predicted aspartyl protease
MPDWSGRFGQDGSPLLRIVVSIAGSPSVELDAVIDTGFNGFLCLPLSQVTIYRSQITGVIKAMLADGSQAFILEVKSQVQVDGESFAGTAVIERDGKDALIGMEFLRTSRHGLILSLVNETVRVPEER